MSKPTASDILPPVLDKRPHMVPFGAVPGQNRGDKPVEPIVYLEDPYFYVRDDSRKNAHVLEHLRAENAYTEAKTAHLLDVRENLYNELLSHVQETDQELPHPYGPYLYYTRTEKGSSYTFHCRKAKQNDDASASEELLLDENAIAGGHTHCDVARVQVSPDHRYLAYMVDTNGYETYTGYIKDLTTGALLPERLEGISDLLWGKDSSELFYATQDESHRQSKIWRHTVGASGPNVCLYTEPDGLYFAILEKTRSGAYMQFRSSSMETSEVWLLDLENPSKGIELVAQREQGVKYSLDHHGDFLYIVTNKDNATNFKLMRTPVTALGSEHWRDVFPYESTVTVTDVECFQDFLVMRGREGGFSQLWIVTENDHNDEVTKYRIPFDDASYAVWDAVNRDYDTPYYRFVYTSMTTPRTTYDVDVATHALVFRQEKPCPNYDRSLYASERMEATAADGTKVPISLVYRKDLRTKTERQPLHLYGYGSYGACIDPGFNPTTLPLLDRGVMFAIAHIRGGGEMGRTWYESAKYKTKITTFTDFIACAEHVIAAGVTSASLMTCEGRSAGGLLMGAVLNMRPDLFTAAIAGVPFVDVMNTISDALIPLTTAEWQEWGNPNESEYFHYMLSYSPYENVRRQAYPTILATSGLNDPRVAYWEPTKWVARLRDLKTDNNDVLLKTDLSAGHVGASDRYHYLREEAFEVAFLLDQTQCVRDANKEKP